MKAFLFNPPGTKFQRGEDRCQADVEAGATVTLRPPNDLGYLAALLRAEGWEVRLRDYPARGEGAQTLWSEAESFGPDLALLSTTVGSLPADAAVLAEFKRRLPGTFLAAKGAPFSVYTDEFFGTPAYRGLDAGIRGEAEAVVPGLARALSAGGPLESVDGIMLRRGERMIARGEPGLVADLDRLPYPDRSLMDNRLYTLPSGRPLATVQTARGCPCSCSFCLTPVLSGSKLRSRGRENILGELEECVRRFGIGDFFFRADTFTLDREFVIGLCRGIVASGLKVRWVANSRVDTLDAEMLAWMRRAGCWLVALGLESGSDRTLARAGKGTTTGQGRRAVALARAAGLKTLGFFMIGFPWETESAIRATMAYALEVDCDFAEVHIAVPYPGTALFREAAAAGLISTPEPGYDYFLAPPAGTEHLARERLSALRTEFLRKLYCRPSYVVRTLAGIRNWREGREYLVRGCRILGAAGRSRRPG
ncbi:MAG TPA: radical SAM protein [bacterium]|nr:radical SAM protein [bacterium]HPQ65356.1 radical SAM protein [bacterium]